MKIGISLLTCNDFSYMKPCLESLLSSDLKNYEYKLFHWDNNSNDGSINFVNSLNIEKNVFTNSSNHGIVIPRIRLYEKIKEECDFLLEIHADMLFPKEWFTSLLEIDDDNTIVLEPHIFTTSKRSIGSEELEKLCSKHKEDKVYHKCLQVHPWLIKLNMLNKIGGYYDEIYSPQRCEDDDFVYRILSSGYDIKSTKKSWVLHYGGVTRSKMLNDLGSDNESKFYQKFKITVKDMRDITQQHPCIGI